MKTLKQAARIITRMKAYSIICVLGLVISLAGTLTLVRYIHQEFTVDSFLTDLDRLCLLSAGAPQDASVKELMSNVNVNEEAHFKDPLNHPAIESHSLVYLMPNGEVGKDDFHYPVRALSVDSMFLKLMPREARHGVVGKLSPNDILLDEELAARLFGKENPIGKPLTFAGKPVTVAGVMKNLPGKSSLDYNVIVPENFNPTWEGKRMSIVRLHRAEDMEVVNQWQPIQNLVMWSNSDIVFRLLPLKDCYFESKMTINECDSMLPKGDKEGVRVLVFVAILLFVVGLFNFWNLYAVIMQKRGVEFGVRKVFGAGRGSLFKQLYLENFLLTLAAGLFVGMTIELTDRFLLHSLEIPIHSNPSFDIALGLGMLFGFPLFTMLYPYLRHVYQTPVSSMKSVKPMSNARWSRSFFLMVQYVITFCLIVVSTYLAKQLYDMIYGDLGFNTKDIVRCVVYPEENLDYNSLTEQEVEQWFAKHNANQEQIKQTLNACPDIMAWSTNVNAIWQGSTSTGKPNYKKAGTDNEYVSCEINHISKEDVEIYGLELVEGRNWTDDEGGYDYVMMINESAKRLLGITDINTEQVQTQNRLWNVPRNGKWMEDNPPYQVVGVVKDYVTNQLARKTVPQVYLCTKNMGGIMMPGYSLHVRHLPGKQKEVLKVLSELRNEIAGEGMLDYSMLEDERAKRYENERRVVNIYLLFAALAIMVSCLGLFGLSLYEVRLRYREIALRKVHGAKVSDIINLLFKRYAWMLGISGVIAIPLSIFFIQKYMEEAVYRTPLSWWIFVLALLVVAIVSVGVLFWQIHKAATINPAIVMKSE